jgi:hypothetical protein
MKAGLQRATNLLLKSTHNKSTYYLFFTFSFVELFGDLSVAMATTSVTFSRGLSEGPQGLLQAANIVVDEALLAKILGTSNAHKREHSINFFEIENLQCTRGSKGLVDL